MIYSLRLVLYIVVYHFSFKIASGGGSTRPKSFSDSSNATAPGQKKTAIAAEKRIFPGGQLQDGGRITYASRNN